jgi:hypothetical protein
MIQNSTSESLASIIRESGIMELSHYNFRFIQRTKQIEASDKLNDITHKSLDQANYKYLWEVKAVARIIQEDLLYRKRKGELSDYYEIQVVNSMTMESYFWDTNFPGCEFRDDSVPDDENFELEN